jgi:hypothetical protein
MACRPATEHVIDVPGRSIRLASDRWAMHGRDMDSATFEDREKSDGHARGRLVTVYARPMRDDERRGVQISADEYLEMSASSPGLVTAAIRADRDRYWVLSRETFVRPGLVAPGDVERASPDEFDSHRARFRVEIDETRYLLLTAF